MSSFGLISVARELSIMGPARNYFRLKIDFMDDGLVLDEIVHRRDAVHSSQAALLEPALFGLVVNDRPIVDPDGASADLARDAQGAVDVGRPD